MPITAFDHYTLRCADLDATWAFYRDALGLRVEPREVASGLRAAIVYMQGAWLAHIFQATPEQDAVFGRMQPRDAEMEQWRTGRVHHIALWATGLSELKARLAQHGVVARERAQGDYYRVVVNDPDGVELEINFPIAESR
ncbi:MAG TPA: VOC family protein [Dehalococcoidia bacterium]|nr:VOC family protein [Dehalococcoidia bacterium]